jgi:hypothetical protein
VNVSVLTTLLAPTDFGGNMRGLIIEAVNLDPTNPVTLTLTPVPDLTHPDTDCSQSVIVRPGLGGSIEVQPKILRQRFELTAETNGPGFPVVSIQWQLSLYTAQE